MATRQDELAGAAPAIVTPDPWEELRRFTDARIGLGHCGVSLPVKRWLEFRLAHARARDAVMTPLDEEQVRAGLAAHGLECLSLSSAVADRNEYLTRPDKGRRLSVASRQLLDAWMDAHPGSAPDVSVVICDGLSARAVHENAVPFASRFLEEAAAAGLSAAPVALVKFGRVAVGDDVVLDHIQKAAPDCPSVKNYISIGPKVPEGWCDFNAGIESAPPFVRPEVVNEPGDISLMYFTSGTSGEPKMVAHDFRYPLGHIITAKYWHNLDENSLHFTLADTGWGKAVWGKYYGQWIVGANVFVYDFEKFHPVDVLEMIHKFHITSFCAPPTVYRFLIREDVKKYDISSLKYCTNAGEALNPNVFERWYELTGIKLHEAFGQTETTATVGTYPWIEPRPGSMGKPNPGYDIDLITADGQVAEDGQQGEIIIRTHGRRPEGLFLGYYRDPELTHKNFHDGIYHTGDIAWRDEDGYYWFVGRKDDVIKSSGYRIGPFEVENALMKHEAVVECAVTGVPDEVRGMAVKATVVLSKEFADTPGIEYDVEYRGKEVPALVKDIQDFVKRTTAPYKYPRVIQFVRELPKTISGKIRRVEIRQKDNDRG